MTIKRVVGYKLPEKLHQDVARLAMRFDSLHDSKVWPAHVVEASIRAFLRLEKDEQYKLVTKVGAKRRKEASTP